MPKRRRPPPLEWTEVRDDDGSIMGRCAAERDWVHVRYPNGREKLADRTAGRAAIPGADGAPRATALTALASGMFPRCSDRMPLIRARRRTARAAGPYRCLATGVSNRSIWHPW